MEYVMNTINVLGVYLIPICVAFLGAFSNLLTKIFIREPTHKKISHHISYLLIGQGVFICPLVVLVHTVNNTMSGRQITNIHVFLLALYLAIYITALAYYICMSASEFANAIPFVRYFYKTGPLFLILMSAVVEILAG